MKLLCGLTSRHSERQILLDDWFRQLGEESTSSTAGSHAQISASRASGPASEPSGVACSSISSEPLATYDLATSSWRTSQPSLWDGSSTPFTGRWPKSVLMLSGRVYEQPTLARLMAATGGGASRGTESRWPTVTRLDSTSTANKTARRSDPDSKHHDGTMLTDAARLWPTATTGDAESGQQKPSARRQGGENESLRVAAITAAPRLWPTARAEDAESAGNHPGAVDSLKGAARLWASPKASDTRSGQVSDEVFEKNSRPLTEQATRAMDKLWATPEAADGSRGSETHVRGNPTLLGDARRSMASQSGHLAQTIETAGPTSSSGGRTSPLLCLNPLFVEWLQFGRSGIGLTCICPRPRVIAIEATD